MRTCLKLAAAMLLATMPALAQEPSETVTVFPPYAVKKTLSGSFFKPTTTITVTQTVGYGDLDLASAQDQARLESRFRQAATGICHELEQRYATIVSPPGGNQDCVSNAARQAMARVLDKAGRG